MLKISLLKGTGKLLKVSEKSGNFEGDIEWHPRLYGIFAFFLRIDFLKMRILFLRIEREFSKI